MLGFPNSANVQTQHTCENTLIGHESIIPNLVCTYIYIYIYMLLLVMFLLRYKAKLVKSIEHASKSLTYPTHETPTQHTKHIRSIKPASKRLNKYPTHEIHTQHMKQIRSIKHASKRLNKCPTHETYTQHMKQIRSYSTNSIIKRISNYQINIQYAYIYIYMYICAWIPKFIQMCKHKPHVRLP